MFRIFGKLIALLLFIASILILYDRGTSNSFNNLEPLRRIDPIPRTQQLVNDRKYSEADEYLSFFMQFPYVYENQKAVDLLEEINRYRSDWGYKAKNIKDGIIYGKSDEIEGQIAAGFSDLFVVGDIRDLGMEGYNYFNDDEVDEVIVALSSIGLVATGATIFSAGSTAPIKGAISFLKLAKKSGRMPAWFGAHLISISKKISHPKDLIKVKTLFTDIYNMIGSAGLKNGLLLLSRSTNPSSFKRSLVFARAFGKYSGTLLRVAGKDVIIYYTAMKKYITKESFLHAATYGRRGVERIGRIGEVRFWKSLNPVVKASRLSKVLNKNLAHFINQIPSFFFLFVALVSFVGVI